ncbi:unnamed protein product [Prorocentrum cordatum]|nr:unnamed protein product [Polarella glacialis]
MPSIPEDQPLAWCARESIRSVGDCWVESASIVHLFEGGEGAPLLAPAKASAVGPGRPRQWRRLSCPPLLLHAKEALLGRRAADIKKGRVVRRVVPVALVADTDTDGAPKSARHAPRSSG